MSEHETWLASKALQDCMPGKLIDTLNEFVRNLSASRPDVLAGKPGCIVLRLNGWTATFERDKTHLEIIEERLKRLEDALQSILSGKETK